MVLRISRGKTRSGPPSVLLKAVLRQDNDRFVGFATSFEVFCVDSMSAMVADRARSFSDGRECTIKVGAVDEKG